jgi:hypothetical protein
MSPQPCAFCAAVAFFSFAPTKLQISSTWDQLARQIPQRLILIFGADRAQSHQQLEDRCPVNPGHPHGCPERISLDQTGDYSDAILVAQLVHAFKMHHYA